MVRDIADQAPARLQCPVCRTPLAIAATEDSAGSLRCANDHRFAVIEGIPDLVPAAVLAASDALNESKVHERDWHTAHAPEQDFDFELDEGKLYPWLNYYQLFDIERVLQQHRPANILVTMCGPGFDLPFWRRFTNDVSGTDISTGMIALASRRARDLGLTGDFVTGDVEHLPFADGAYDLVVAHHGLHHLPSLDKAISELLRVSRKLCLICEPVDGPMRRFLHRTQITPGIEPLGTQVFDVAESDVRRISAAAGADVVLVRRFLYKRVAHSKPTPIQKVANALRLPALLRTPLWAFNVAFGRFVGSKATFVIHKRESRRP